MNIITAHFAYALYPRATFVERQGFICTTSGAGQEIGRQKYRDRGWTLLSTLDSSPSPESTTMPASTEFWAGPRWIGDRRTWTIKLDPEVHIPHRCDYAPPFLHAFSWNLEYDERGEAKMEYDVWGDEKLLRFNYTTADLILSRRMLADIDDAFDVSDQVPPL